MRKYTNKVVIVTGGSKGIGEGIVRAFVKAGAKVCFCARGLQAGKALELELNSSFPENVMFVQCDVTNESEIKNVVETTVSTFGTIDCLVNNAGHHPPEQKIDDITAQQFNDVFIINVTNYFLFCKFSLPYLRKNNGNIINLTSLVAQIGQPNSIPYVTSKGAITSMTKAMAIDEAVNNVRVNCISPGNVWTPMWEGLAAATSNPQASVEFGRKSQLLGRYGTLEESGNLALYIAAEATFTTGVDFNLTGGAELGYGIKSMLKEDQ